MKKQNLFRLGAVVALLAVSSVASAMGMPILSPDVMMALGAMGLAGEIGFVEIKNMLDEQGRVFQEFRQTNDALLKAKAEGKAVGDLEAKLAGLETRLSQLDELKAAVNELVTKSNRPGHGADDVSLRDECHLFNIQRKSMFAASGRSSSPSDLTVDEYKQYKSAFNAAIRGRTLSDIEQKALMAASDPDGGLFLPETVTGRVVQRVYETTPMRQLASVQTISTDAMEGINDLDEASVGWVGEAAARSETNTPQVGGWRIQVFEMYAMPKATQKLLDDSAVDVEAWLAAKLSDKFSRTENNAFINGNGTNKPRGLLSYPFASTADASRAWGTFEQVKTGVNGNFAGSNPADNIFDLVGALKQAYLANARWLTTREVITKVRKFKESTTNAYMWQPGLQAGQPDTLLGYPLVLSPDMPALSSNSQSMAFGDFRAAYQIVDRIGIRTLRDPYTSKPYVLFYTTKRVGGGALDFEALKFMTFAA